MLEDRVLKRFEAPDYLLALHTFRSLDAGTLAEGEGTADTALAPT